MSVKYLTCAETAALVRQSLKEAFARVKFTVRSKTYSGGASLSIGWTDGPNVAQVEAVVMRFKGSYFDGGIDYKGTVYALLDGHQQVRFGADFIHTERAYSDEAVSRAIERVYTRYRENFEAAGVAKPTVEAFRRGDLRCLQLAGLHIYGNESVQRDLFDVLRKHSDRLKVEHSKTAARVFITHDDGYSRAVGGGISVVNVDA
jgi:hypothetical protein